MGRRGGPRRWTRIFDQSFWVFFALAVVSGLACYLKLGSEAFAHSFRSDLDTLLSLCPKFGAAFLVAGFVQVLLPRDKVARWLGEKAGFRAIAIATGAGVITPGGPMTSFPLVQALQEAGTGRSALIAYLTSWSTLGMQRILMWEVPLMGLEFAALRFLASLPLPFAAGLISRLITAPRQPPAPGPSPSRSDEP